MGRGLVGSAPPLQSRFNVPVAVVDMSHHLQQLVCVFKLH